MFKKNVGKTDRMIRIVVGIVIASAGLYFQNWWGLLGVVIFLTGVFSFCGLYSLIGISTCPIESPKQPEPPKT